MDGKFDDQGALQADGTVVKVGGPLNNADGLSVDLQVIVVQNDAVAEGTGRNQPGSARWSGEASVLDGPALARGVAIAYAAAVGTGDGGISTYQWHRVVNLK